MSSSPPTFSQVELDLRQTLAGDPHSQQAATELARLLNRAARHQDCIAATDRAANVEQPAEALLIERARAFQALGRHGERLALREHLARIGPERASAHHNLAAALGDCGYPERAEDSARRAIALGSDAPETWLVLARALQSQNRLNDADGAFGEALSRRPSYLPALRDRAQLEWMRTGDLEKALAVLNADLQEQTDQMLLLRARLLEAAGKSRDAYDLLAAHCTGHAQLELAAGRMALDFDVERALAHTSAAQVLAPGAEAVERQFLDTWLAADRPDAALQIVDMLLQRHPGDQGLVARRWTAWRLAGDPRARQLYDYASYVRAQMIDTPAGWDSLSSYLRDLATSLKALHAFAMHPMDQSLRFGSQTSANLLNSYDPAIRAFREAIDRPIRAYLATLGSGGDPLRVRNSGEYRLNGMWSVRLRQGGYHKDHVHPDGWLSSACYIELPKLARDTNEGWIRFGQPGLPMLRPLDAEFMIEPCEGMLVLFPSFMWHGTQRLVSAGERLTIAFDLVPG